MKKQNHFIKKIITAIFCLLLITTAFIPGIQLNSEGVVSSSLSDSSKTYSETAANKITPSQLINAANKSKEEIEAANDKLIEKEDQIITERLFNSEEAAQRELASSKEASEYFSIYIRNKENIISINDSSITSSSANKDFINSSKVWSIATITFYVLASVLFVLMILQTFLNIKAFAVITKILSVLVLLGAIASFALIFPMSIYQEITTDIISSTSKMFCSPTLAGAIAVILSIPTMILSLCSFKNKK